MYCHAPRSTQSGVTFIELLTVIVMAGILMSIGVGSYRFITDKNRVAGEVNGLLGDLQLARVEAIKEGLPVAVCVSTSGTACTGGTSWNKGWIVFVDANGNGTVDAGEAVLRVQASFTSTDTFTSTNGASIVTFNREGYAVGLVAGTLLTLHDAAGLTKVTRCLNLTMVGMMTVSTYGGACT